MSVFQRQAHLTAGTVIDAKNLPHVAVCRTAGVFLCQLRDGFRMCPCQLLHQPLPAVLALVYGDEAGHTPDYTGKVGIHIALPRLVDDAKHLDVALTAIYFIAISGLPAHCQLGRFILLAQKKLLSFWAEISAAKLIFADPCKRFVLVRKLDFFHFKLDKAVLFQDAVAEFPIVKDTTPNMMNPRLYTTSYNKPQGQQFDDTAVLSFIKLQYT